MGEERGRVHFPLSEAFALSLQSVRLRLGRMAIVLAGVGLAVAFMTALYVMGGMYSGIHKLFPQADVSAARFARWWIVVAVLISVAGITNSMLMSVTERIKEIGTMKCLGAVWTHIVQIFLFEAALVGLIGGVAGACVGVLFALMNMMAQFGAEAASLATTPLIARGVGLGTALSVGLCLVSSAYPVYFASRIEAAEALRYEV